jgi:nucleotide-binding universal stress UspA family protein
MAKHDRHGDPSPAPMVGAANTLILVGFDGSANSWDALSWACGEAQRSRGRVLAVWVSSSTDLGIAAVGSALVGLADGEAGRDLADAERREAMRLELKSFAADHYLELAFVHTRGNPASELVRLAAAHHADLIVVGRSRKARHHLPGLLGRRLACDREAPIVVVVPLPGG